MPSSRSSVVAVVLAGGFGTRVHHLLPAVPKPMAVVAGRPFLEHVARFLSMHGIRDIILSTGHLSEVIDMHFTPDRVPGVDIACVRESTPLGTAGGFLRAARSRAVRPNVWLVTNGDSLALVDLGAFLAVFENNDWDAAIIGLAVADASRFGSLECNPDSSLRRFAEKRSGKGLINAGLYLFRERMLADFSAKIPLSFETDVFPHLLERGARILVYPVDAPFLDIGTPETLAQAEGFVETNAALLVGPAASKSPQ